MPRLIGLICAKTIYKENTGKFMSILDKKMSVKNGHLKTFCV